jgi:hypothetical protein
MKISSLLTYQDTGGHRHLRDYVKVTVLILVLVVAASAVGLYNRYRMVSEVMAEPRPLDPALVSTPTEQAVSAVSANQECPANPADWTLTENSPIAGGNLMGLSPECVYDQLDKTAAWFYATSVFGYSRQEATDLLGFSTIPVQYQLETGEITVLTDFKDEPQKVNLRFPSNHASLREWRIDANGEPAVELSFVGCFRTSSMSGGSVTSWGEGFPVICQYFGDLRTKHLVSDANGKTLTISGSQNLRRPMWFGYAGSGNWMFLGDAPDWDVDLSQIPNLGVPTVNATTMSEKYGISSMPLPENWQAFTGQEFVDAFLTDLNGSR